MHDLESPSTLPVSHGRLSDNTSLSFLTDFHVNQYAAISNQYTQKRRSKIAPCLLDAFVPVLLRVDAQQWRALPALCP